AQARIDGRRICGLALGLLALSPWLVLALWAAPSADDYCFFSFVRRHGWLGAQQFVFDRVTGRFTSTALFTGMGWLTDAFGGEPFALYAPLAALAVLLLVLQAWRSVGRLFPGCRGIDRLIVAGFIAAVLLATLPSANDVLYWANAIFIYLPAILLVWHVLLRAIDAAQGARSPSAAELAMLWLLGFIGAGAHGPLAPLPLLV